MRYFVGFLIIYLLVYMGRNVYREHVYYVKNIKPQEDAFNQAMREYWKACAKSAREDFKKSWAEFRGKKVKEQV